MATERTDLDSLDASLVQEEIEINPDANPLETPPPVDDGINRVKLSIMDPNSDGGFDHSETKGDNPQAFLKCRVTGVVLAEGTSNNNKRVFDNVNTLVFDGKSRMAYILIQALQYGETGLSTEAAKSKVAGLRTYVDLAKAFRDALLGEPVVKVKTSWLAQRKIEGGGKNGADKYETVLSGQKKFPPVDPRNPSRGYVHIIHDKKTDTDISAQAQIVDYFPDK